MRNLLLLLFCSLPVFINAQGEKDSVLFLNGKSIIGEIQGFDLVKGDSVIQFKTFKKNGNPILNNISHDRVFSYTHKGLSRTIYTPNEFIGDFLSVKETEAVTIGSFDARHTFKPHVPFWTGFALGLGASIWDTYLTKKEASDSTLIEPKTAGFFKGKPSVFPFFVPVVLSVSWAIPSFRLKEKKMIHKNYMNNENYYRGYHRIAKQKRMLGSLFGGLSGVLVGMVTYYIIQ